MTLAITLGAAILIGVSLGLLGGGGSILTIPVLIYLAGVDPKPAIAMSLFVVGATSAAGVIPHARAGRVRWRTGVVFGLAGMTGAYAGGRLAEFIPAGVLLAAFGVMMAVTAAAMLRGRKPIEPGEHPAEHPTFKIIIEGVVVGLVTGLVGAGGGFLVVPALALLGGLPMPVAVGTSLVVIAMKSFAGLAGYLSSVHIDWGLTLAVTAMAIGGSFIGSRFAGRVDPEALRKAFGWFVVAMSVFVLAEQAPEGVRHAVFGTPAGRASIAAAVAIVIALIVGARSRAGGATPPTQSAEPSAPAEPSAQSAEPSTAPTERSAQSTTPTERSTALTERSTASTSPESSSRIESMETQMYFAQHYLDCLSQASYLIGDKTTGRAVVVDPRRDVSEYLDDAEANGLHIEGVINTHFHADFIAGHLEIAARTGAWIGYGSRAEAEYSIRKLTDHEKISLGDVTLEILETPGHTPESISILVYEHADDTVPYGVLTGDALFIGDVGRPDLLASIGFTADQLGRELYDTIQHKLMGLPDEVRVFPAHGAGSACGKNLSTELESTIGAQRLSNYACTPMEEAEFVAIVTEGQPSAPGYFVYDAVLNRKERDLLQLDEHLKALSVQDVLARRDAGAMVIDARDPHEFASGHLKDSVNVPAAGRFAEQAGMVIEPGREIVVVAPEGRHEELITRLARIGMDKVAGYLDDPEVAFASVPEQMRKGTRVTVDELTAALAGDRPPVLLDVRNVGELVNGFVEGSVNIPLAELPKRLGELPEDRPVAIYCASGNRSSVAYSLLNAAGRTEVSDLLGGYDAWQRAMAKADA